jgi:nucleoside-diphosphate kinase
MLSQDPTEIAFLMVKPDGVRRRLVGQILARIERTDLELLALRLSRPSATRAAQHYRRKRNGSSGISLRQAVDYLTSGPVLLSAWRGTDACRELRKLVGNSSDPWSCAVGTIRRDFAADSIDEARREARAVHNVVHSSSRAASALAEVRIWFGPAARDMWA